MTGPILPPALVTPDVEASEAGLYGPGAEPGYELYSATCYVIGPADDEPPMLLGPDGEPVERPQQQFGFAP